MCVACTEATNTILSDVVNINKRESICAVMLIILFISHTLNEKELKEYSALKTAKIGEELDDDDVDEELSSDEEENSSSTASDSAGDSDSGVSEEDED
ncbi:hypothetical protein J6590_014513 [Homalodisca vitripennis]|nr:hypothetical protein J6590_014513 [Homalodisca vitripennis]